MPFTQQQNFWPLNIDPSQIVSTLQKVGQQMNAPQTPAPGNDPRNPQPLPAPGQGLKPMSVAPSVMPPAQDNQKPATDATSSASTMSKSYAEQQQDQADALQKAMLDANKAPFPQFQQPHHPTFNKVTGPLFGLAALFGALSKNPAVGQAIGSAASGYNQSVEGRYAQQMKAAEDVYTRQSQAYNQRLNRAEKAWQAQQTLATRAAAQASRIEELDLRRADQVDKWARDNNVHVAQLQFQINHAQAVLQKDYDLGIMNANIRSQIADSNARVQAARLALQDAKFRFDQDKDDRHNKNVAFQQNRQTINDLYKRADDLSKAYEKSLNAAIGALGAKPTDPDALAVWQQQAQQITANVAKQYDASVTSFLHEAATKAGVDTSGIGGELADKKNLYQDAVDAITGKKTPSSPTSYNVPGAHDRDPRIGITSFPGTGQTGEMPPDKYQYLTGLIHKYAAGTPADQFADQLAKIAFYGESGGDPNAINPNGGAAGLWQIYGHGRGNWLDPDTNAKEAVQLVLGRLARHEDPFADWEASRSMWSPHVYGTVPATPGSPGTPGTPGTPGALPRQPQTVAGAELTQPFSLNNPNSMGGPPASFQQQPPAGSPPANKVTTAVKQKVGGHAGAAYAATGTTKELVAQYLKSNGPEFVKNTLVQHGAKPEDADAAIAEAQQGAPQQPSFAGPHYKPEYGQALRNWWINKSNHPVGPAGPAPRGAILSNGQWQNTY